MVLILAGVQEDAPLRTPLQGHQSGNQRPSVGGAACCHLPGWAQEVPGSSPPLREAGERLLVQPQLEESSHPTSPVLGLRKSMRDRCRRRNESYLPGGRVFQQDPGIKGERDVYEGQGIVIPAPPAK